MTPGFVPEVTDTVPVTVCSPLTVVPVRGAEIQTLTVYAADGGLLARQVGPTASTAVAGCTTLLVARIRMSRVPKNAPR